MLWRGGRLEGIVSGFDLGVDESGFVSPGLRPRLSIQACISARSRSRLSIQACRSATCPSSPSILSVYGLTASLNARVSKSGALSVFSGSCCNCKEPLCPEPTPLPFRPTPPPRWYGSAGPWERYILSSREDESGRCDSFVGVGGGNVLCWLVD